ncbi:hypothetical protein SGLAM104S_03366 [Streptomyces glaucescens]
MAEEPKEAGPASPGFQNPVAGFGVTFKAMFKKRLTEQYPEQKKTTRSPSELTVSKTLRERGQIRDVSAEALNDLRALEQRAEERLERTGIESAAFKRTEEASK